MSYKSLFTSGANINHPIVVFRLTDYSTEAGSARLDIEFRKSDDSLSLAKKLDAAIRSADFGAQGRLTPVSRDMLHEEDPSPNAPRRLRYRIASDLANRSAMLGIIADKMLETELISAEERRGIGRRIVVFEDSVRKEAKQNQEMTPVVQDETQRPVVYEYHPEGPVPSGKEIHVYVDGSWRDALEGISGAGAGGGWGAVVVDASQPEAKKRLLAGRTGPDIASSMDAEYSGMVAAMREMKNVEHAGEPKPKIVLHTDQLNFISYVKTAMEGEWPDEYVSPRLKMRADKIVELVRDMGASVVYESDPKGGRCADQEIPPISVAHELAGYMALQGLHETRQGLVREQTITAGGNVPLGDLKHYVSLAELKHNISEKIKPYTLRDVKIIRSALGELAAATLSIDIHPNVASVEAGNGGTKPRLTIQIDPGRLSAKRSGYAVALDDLAARVSDELPVAVRGEVGRGYYLVADGDRDQMAPVVEKIMSALPQRQPSRQPG